MKDLFIPYFSIFRWLGLFIILGFHAVFIFPQVKHIPFFSDVRPHIPLLVDCFFVMSGFLLFLKYSESDERFFSYAKKKFSALFPMLLSFWIFFQICSFLGFINVDLISGFKDVLGLNVFGVPWYHNQYNYTWFCYALFWGNLFYYFLLIRCKKLLSQNQYDLNKVSLLYGSVCLIVVICFGLLLFKYWLSSNRIVAAPIKSLFLSMGSYRCLYAMGIGVLSCIFAKKIKACDFSFLYCSIFEFCFFILFLVCFMLPERISYFLGVICFSLMGVSFFQGKGLLSKVLSLTFFSYGVKFIYSIYIMSGIAFLLMHNVLKNGLFNQWNYFCVVLISIVWACIFGVFSYFVVHKTFFVFKIQKYFYRFIVSIVKILYKYFFYILICCSIGYGVFFYMNYSPIPKIIHYVWVGPNPMPKDFKKVLASWKKYAPDYKIMRWGNKTCDIEENTFAKLAYQEKNYAFVSDYCRMKALYEFGGVYLDTDHEIKKNAFSVLSRTNLVLTYDKVDQLSASFIATVPNHPFIKYMFDFYNNLDQYDVKNSIPEVFTDVFKIFFAQKLDGNCFHSKELTIIPSNILMLDLGGGENVAVHHYEGSWSVFKNGWFYNERKDHFLTEVALPVCLADQKTQHIIKINHFGSGYLYETKEPVQILWQTKDWLLLWQDGFWLLNYKNGCYTYR